MDSDAIKTEKPRIGVFSPYLQGHFFGELITQLQQYCLLKGYRFSLIKTDSLGEYDSPLHTEHLDFCIVLRNAVHPSLLEKILARGTRAVSIAYNYFPLDVPMVGCDNELGVELAVNHLIKEGHRSLAFVGDIKNYDIRCRYEAFCDQLDINDFDLDDKAVFIPETELIVGGYNTAVDFIKNNCKATGILCGSGLTGLGFDHKISQLVPHRRDALSIVCFDALSLIPVVQPKLTVVDQNLHFVAYKALQVFDSYERGDAVEQVLLVEPQIRTEKSDYKEYEQAYLATTTEVAELMNPNYIKGVLDNLYEWPKSIIEGNLDDITMLEVLFPGRVDKACYARIVYAKDKHEFVKITKVMNQSGVHKTASTDRMSISSLAKYPSDCENLAYDKVDTAIHMPICKDGSLWGVFSVFGRYGNNEKLSSLRGLFAYLERISSLFYMKIIEKENRLRDTQKVDVVKTSDSISGLIRWNKNERECVWDDEALSMLGIESDLEKNIYGHMNILDSVAVDDLKILCDALNELHEKPIHLELRLRHRDRMYRRYQLAAETVAENGVYSLQLMPVDISS